MPLETARSRAVWSTPSVRELARTRWPTRFISSLDELGDECEELIVVGGGRMMDEAKHFRFHRRPGMTLVLVPSIWGSGAERSPIVVLNQETSKHIEMGPQFLPDSIIYWTDLLPSIKPDRARNSCGDVWAHALEAFLSPLASEETQASLAQLIKTMADLPLTTDQRWFEISGRACELQAKASVGLVHGLAHVVEPILNDVEWGHARLCSVFLAPVMELNRRNSSKFHDRCATFGLEVPSIDSVLKDLNDPSGFRQLFPAVRESWPQILRDPCTRTNGALIRPKQLSFFEEWANQ